MSSFIPVNASGKNGSRGMSVMLESVAVKEMGNVADSVEH